MTEERERLAEVGRSVEQEAPDPSDDTEGALGQRPADVATEVETRMEDKGLADDVERQIAGHRRRARPDRRRHVGRLRGVRQGDRRRAPRGPPGGDDLPRAHVSAQALQEGGADRVDVGALGQRDVDGPAAGGPPAAVGVHRPAARAERRVDLDLQRHRRQRPGHDRLEQRHRVVDRDAVLAQRLAPRVDGPGRGQGLADRPGRGERVEPGAVDGHLVGEVQRAPASSAPVPRRARGARPRGRTRR